MLVDLAREAGLPDGVVNVINGAHVRARSRARPPPSLTGQPGPARVSQDAVNFVCDNEHVRAISFVGGNEAGHHIHDRGTRNGKRVQANLGAKNHCVIMPDADKDATLNALVGAGFGAAGQRCMALSVAVFVDEAAEWSVHSPPPCQSQSAAIWRQFQPRLTWRAAGRGWLQGQGAAGAGGEADRERRHGGRHGRGPAHRRRGP